jgi:hypothetical protein
MKMEEQNEDLDTRRIKRAIGIGAAIGATTGLAAAAFCGYEAGSAVCDYMSLGDGLRRGVLDSILILKLAESYVPVGKVVGAWAGGASLVVKEIASDKINDLRYSLSRMKRNYMKGGQNKNG